MRKLNSGMVAVVALICIGLPAAATGLEDEVALLTKEEAASLAAQPLGRPIDVAAGLDDGPAIEMVAPTAGEEVSSPFRLHIRFSSQNGRDVELGRLKVELVKTLSFDITRRIIRFVSRDGIRIDRVALPKGEFGFKVSLGDVAGGVTTRMFFVKVN